MRRLVVALVLAAGATACSSTTASGSNPYASTTNGGPAPTTDVTTPQTPSTNPPYALPRLTVFCYGTDHSGNVTVQVDTESAQFCQDQLSSLPVIQETNPDTFTTQWGFNGPVPGGLGTWGGAACVAVDQSRDTLVVVVNSTGQYDFPSSITPLSECVLLKAGGVYNPDGPNGGGWTVTKP